jgi:hypothetical protein
MQKLLSNEYILLLQLEVKKSYMSSIIGTDLKIIINLHSLLQIHCYDCIKENQKKKKMT